VSLRVDLYPIVLSRFSVLFGPDGSSRARELVERLRATGRTLDEAHLEDLLSGRLRSSHPSVEDGVHAALVAAFAYELRETEPEVLFDMGGIWNFLEMLATVAKQPIPPWEQDLLEVLLSGRPLLGEAIRSDWNSYTWITVAELDTFHALVERLERADPYDVNLIKPWLRVLRAKRFDVFVAIG